MVNPKLRKAVAVKDDDGASAAVAGAAVGAAAVDTEVATSVAQSSVVEEHELDGVRAAYGDVLTEERYTESAILSDPKLAAANPHLLLDRELELLAAIEAKRTDRLPQVPAGARNVLEVRNLSIRFPGRFGDTAIVDNVSFTVREGETMGLVGESGCGKSITSLAVMGLLPKTAQVTGSIKFDGKELLDPETKHSKVKAYEGLRGEQIAMVYQDALSSLNPSMKIKAQMEQLT
jgi:peptide/nickel transport system permease protein